MIPSFRPTAILLLLPALLSCPPSSSSSSAAAAVEGGNSSSRSKCFGATGRLDQLIPPDVGRGRILMPAAASFAAPALKKQTTSSLTNVGGAFLLPSASVPRRKPVALLNENINFLSSANSHRKLAFVSHFLVQHSSITADNDLLPLSNRYCPPRVMNSVLTQRTPGRKPFALFASKDVVNYDASSDGDEDEECSLQRLYQQVQEEDSEWYMETFSKLFDDEEDPASTIPPCTSTRDVEREGYATVVADESGEDAGRGGEEETKIDQQVDRNETSGRKGGTNIDQQVDREEAAKIVIKTKDKSKEAGENDDLREEDVLDSPLPFVSNESVEEDRRAGLQEQPRQQQGIDDGDDEEENLPLEDVPPSQCGAAAESFPNDMKEDEEEVEATRRLPRNAKRKYYEDDDEYEDLDEYDDDYDYDNGNDDKGDVTSKPLRDEPTPRSKANQRRQSKSPPGTIPASTDADSTPSPAPGKIVQLRNSYTKEAVRLSSLPALGKLGYSEKELLVLKPQVLELIVEDGIPRPAKGLPKRWVRLRMLESYEGEEEEEDEEDVDWEVEVVNDRKSTKEEAESKEKQWRNDSMENGNDAEEEEEWQPYSESPPISKEIMQNDDKVTSQTSESWGPFTSSRVVSDKRRSEPKFPSGSDDNEEEGDEDDGRQYNRPNARDGYAGKKRQRQRQVPPRRQQEPVDVGEDDASFGRGRYGEEQAEDTGYDDGRRRQRRIPPKSKSKRRRPRDYEEYSDSRKVPRGDIRQGQQRQRPPSRRRELRIDRGSYSDDPPSNKFWMDLPTFRGFLRKEAQLRLKILGPDWKESVLDESRWRYDLYRTWLVMLDEGVGENPLYEYGERPRPRGQQQPGERTRGPLPRSRRGEGEYNDPPRQRRQLRRPRARVLDEEEDNYDDQYDGRPAPRRRRTRSETRPREEEERERGSGLWSEEVPGTSHDSRGGGGTSWKNFSDLEESLVQGSFAPDGKTRSERREYYYPSHKNRRSSGVVLDEGDEYEESASVSDKDDEEEESPIRRRRRSITHPAESGLPTRLTPSQYGSSEGGMDGDVQVEEDGYYTKEGEVGPPRKRRSRSE